MKSADDRRMLALHLTPIDTSAAFSCACLAARLGGVSCPTARDHAIKSTCPSSRSSSSSSYFSLRTSFPSTGHVIDPSNFCRRPIASSAASFTPARPGDVPSRPEPPTRRDARKNTSATSSSTSPPNTPDHLLPHTSPPTPVPIPPAAPKSGPARQPHRKRTRHPHANVRQHVRTLFRQAKTSESAGRFDHARALLRQCLQLDRKDSHSWLALARLEARMGGVTLPLTAAAGPQHPAAADRPSPGSRGAHVARALFEEGLSECPCNVHLLQAWAVHEHRCGNRDAARTLFSRGLDVEPDNPYICQAWGLLEQRVGNNDKARQLFHRTVSIRPHPEVCAAWAALEAREGNIDRARELYEQGLRACASKGARSYAAICCAWAEIEERVGDMPRARSLLSKAIASRPQASEAYIALGRLEARRGGTTRALELMRAAASLSSKPPATVFNHWALIEWQQCGRPDEARRLLERGHELHPSDPALFQTQGTLEDKLGDPHAAKKFFLASVRARPTAPALVAWALLEEREGNYEEAKCLFEQALEVNKLHGAAYNAYGMMEARRGSLEAARAVFERGLAMSSSASVCHGYGQLELKIGRNPDRAREIFRQGTNQTCEGSAFIWHSWGMLELAERQVTAARDVFREAMKRYPRNSRLLVGAAMAEVASCHRTRSNQQGARELFKRAIGADPTHAHAWQAWGVFELRQGREDAALALFRRGLRLCPSHGALWQAWGVLETSRGNFGKARHLFDKGTQACPGHVHLFQAWACMEVQAGNIDRARQLLDRALESDSSHGPVWNAYGLLEARHGTLAKARQNFVTGIRRAPHHAPLYRAFGQTEAMAGNYDKARQLFEEGLRVDPRHAPLYHALAQFEALFGNVSALAKLKKQAENFFGSEAEAVRAIHSGDDNSASETAKAPEESMESRYDAKATPMELALDLPTVDEPQSG